MRAAEVSLDEEGYRTIAKMNSEREMLYFVKRAAEENGYVISDIGSLHGVVPYYSGKKATQSFLALQDELSRTSKQPKGWARKSAKKQKAMAKHLKLSAKHLKLSAKALVDDDDDAAADDDDVDDKRELEAPSGHKKKDVRRKLPSRKTTKHDLVVTMAHANKDKYVREGNRNHFDKVGVEKPRARDHKVKADASKDYDEHVKNKRRDNDAIKIVKAQHDSLAKTMPKRDLASTEATELDETMFAAEVENSARPKVKHMHEDAIKKKAVSTLHVVGQVKVEQGHLIKPTHATDLIKPTHATATPPAKNDPKHSIH
jgi:hypothetical protein